MALSFIINIKERAVTIMELGTNIKRLRVEKEYTQKFLADKLSVTAQAVSRWENNEVEPDVDTLKKLSEIFGVSLDELATGKAIKKPAISEPQIAVVPPVITQPTAAPLVAIGVCEKCNKPILEGQPIHRYSTHTRGHSTSHILCQSCNNARDLALKNETIRLAKVGRIKGLGWGIPAGLITLAIMLVLAITQSLPTGYIFGDIVISIVAAYAVFSLVFCCLAENNFVGEWFISIASWGFVRMPGIIFSLDLDGIIWLLTVKLFLFLLGISLAIAAFLLAVAICGALSMFVFPFSIRWTFTNPEKTEAV